ncbi:alpha/beta hydrolase [Undibacterium sp. Ren11W]|uniref:alpha/beta hydrolase n=1 Tax=Undibacterium sp. Ren11W TaxID=3413045 RepID=UPI003BEFF9C6
MLTPFLYRHMPQLRPGLISLCLLPLLLVNVAEAATKACRHPDFPQEVQCGEILRPLNPAQPEGKKITVHYVVLPSQDRNKLPDAVFLLAGGPGQSAINVASFGQAVLSRLNRRRDLVFVDQRGTGRSAPLHCPELEEASEVVDNESMQRMAQSCMKNLQALPYGDLQYFSTSIAVQDLEAVRLAQNYGRINLLGVSYGTRAGLEYLRQYPKSVRRLVLDGVTPPTMRLPSADAQAALNGVFAACLADALCNQNYPDLAARWKKLLHKLTPQLASTPPGKISFTHPRLGSQITAPLTRDALLGLVHKTLYSAASTAGLPYALTQAELGNLNPLIALSNAYNLAGPGAIAYGMHFSVWCGEAYARPVTASPAIDDFDALSAGMYDRVCEKWPRATIPAEFFSTPPSQSPVLLLSGGIDPVTPSRHGAAVSKALGQQARHLVVENVGHGLLTHGCVRDVVYRYLNAKEDVDAIKVDVSCLRQIPRPLAWQAPLTTSPAPNKLAAQKADKS